MAKANLLDALIPASEQIAWIDSPLLLDGRPIRPSPILADDPYDDRLELLLASPEWPEFAAFLRGYIENGVPKPLDTQPGANNIGWCNLTLGDKAGRVQISVNHQYAVIVDFRADARLQIEVTAEQRPYLEYRFPQFTKAQGVEGNTDA